MLQIKNIIILILKAVSVVTLLALLASAFSDRVSPYTCIWLQYSGLFFPFILWFNVFLFILFLFLRKWKTSLIFTAVFLICFDSIHTYFPFHSRTENLPEGCIKILSYNVMRFEYMQKHTEKHPNPIIRYILDQDADIICIQEYGAWVNDNKKFISRDDIRRIFKSFPYVHIEPFKPSRPEFTFGSAVFSKYPILKTKKIPYDSEYNGSFITELDIRGKKVTLINNHLESNKLSEEERTGYYDLTKNIDTEKLENFTNTMFRRLTPAYKSRALQAQLIDKAIREDKNPYIIVCGDFNDTPVSYARHKIKGRLKDAFVSSGNGM
ncbi:MAG: endonuclease/exonuclease/phosphatase family protein, partial [Candidatus Symbiothrix sp.]|nr:endonuclease/exonuclease/phosphatase family protein [Candidatus Symbiothrix sp.]